MGQKLGWLSLLVFVFCFVSCKQDKQAPPPTEELVKTTRRKIPKFDEENTYQLIQKQVDFGPRYPGTEAHKNLITYLTSELEKVTDRVITQDFKVSFLDEKNVNATNIIGSINPNVTKRILLAAHFDTRKIAEKDENKEMRDQPILGADDGASGVGVLLELARLIHENGIDIGVDFVLFDAEDNGSDKQNWCLGSKHWSKNPHVNGYKAEFGILLDMVGAKNAVFSKEGFSVRYAPEYVKKIWKLAERMAYGNYFQNVNGGGVEDDHIYVIQNLGIPMVDIINLPNEPDLPHGFGHYHHTHKDDMDIIDKNTLRAVGKVVLAVVYNFNNGTF